MKPSTLHRRSFLRSAGLSALAVAASSQPGLTATQSADERPNIILILSDQQHHDTIAAAGAKGVVTPGMDRLVRRGTRFAHSHSTNPVCGPCRSSLFTGRATSETGVFKNGIAIGKGIPNIGEWLQRKSDYETYYAGKWHLSRYYSNSVPGFTVLTTGLGGQGMFSDASTTSAIEAFLLNRTAKDKPFFLALNYLQPHDICEWLRLNTKVPSADRSPEIVREYPDLPANYQPNDPEPAVLKRRRKNGEASKGQWTDRHWQYYRWSYLRHVEIVDAQVERVMRMLEATGLIRNTVVIFTADHGEGFGEHKMVRKSSPYNASLKVPLVISAPSHTKAVCNTTDLVSSFDFVPTVCDYAGIAPPPKQRGRSLRPILEGRTGEDYPVVVCEVDEDRCRVVRTRQYKYITYHDDPNDMLFDLDADPGETKNLAADAAHAKTLAAMKKNLLDWEAKLSVSKKQPLPNAWWRGKNRT